MKKILIVDDDLTIRELVSATLQIGPYVLLTADGGPEAVEIAQQEKPALILLDIAMPGEYDGLEVCRRLKSNAQTQDIHIVMLTANWQPVDRTRSFEAGANDYIRKPFSPLELMRKVEEVLEHP